MQTLQDTHAFCLLKLRLSVLVEFATFTSRWQHCTFSYALVWESFKQEIFVAPVAPVRMDPKSTKNAYEKQLEAFAAGDTV